MLLFIIYGTRGVATVVGGGTFACPRCKDMRPYARKAVRRFFALYYIPLIPLDQVGEHFECQVCLAQFDPQHVSDYEVKFRTSQLAKYKEDVYEHIKRTLIFTALAGGEVTDEVIESIRAIHKEFVSVDLTAKEVDREFYLARLAKTGLAPYPRRFPGVLREPDKVLILHAMYKLGTSRGAMTDAVRLHIEEVSSEMGITATHLRQILYGVAST